MKRIWLIRHAESMAQVDESVCPVNPDLTPHGEDQARLLRSRISEIESDIVLLSPLTRAWRTYLLSEYSCEKVVYDKRLIECDWGIADFYPDSLFDDLPDIAENDPAKANGLPARERATMLMDFIVGAEYSSYTLFGHCGILMEILRTFTGCDDVSEHSVPQNTSISLLEIDDAGGRQVTYWNDFAHLPAPPTSVQ